MARMWWKGGVVLLSALILFAWPRFPPTPAMLKDLPINLFGPANTKSNWGYESANHISPILPSSYRAAVPPGAVGIQFVADSAEHLKADGFLIRISGRRFHGQALSPNFYDHGFVGFRFQKPLIPGTYHLQFQLTDFNLASPRWTLQVANDAGPTGPSDLSRVLLDSINSLRRTIKLSPIHWSGALQQASQAHAQYLAQHGFSAPSFHQETPQNTGFTGTSPWNRDLRFGWPTPEAGEVGIEWSEPAEAATVVQDLVDTVYHRLSLLSGNLVAGGAGAASGSHGSVVMDLGFGYRGDLPPAVVYPFDGQPGVPTGWVDIESPDPVGSGGYGKKFGYPITVDLPTVGTLSGVTVRVRRNGFRVPVIVDYPGRGDTGKNQIGLVPKRVLGPDSLYTVDVRAHARFNGGQERPIHVHWQFATGASDQSLAATVPAADAAIISDVTAGSGIPLSGQPLTLYRRMPGGTLETVDRGTTNQEGLWRVRPPVPGLYEAVSRTDNAVVFWWRA